MVLSIGANWAFGLAVARWRDRRAKRFPLYLAGIFNLGLLGWFKYANFFADSLNAIVVPLGLSPVELAPIHLPIGISFFTFQALSYVIDVYRREGEVQRNPHPIAGRGSPVVIENCFSHPNSFELS